MLGGRKNHYFGDEDDDDYFGIDPADDWNVSDPDSFMDELSGFLDSIF